MMVLVTTRHSKDFDIYTESIDPAKSPYARTVRDYVARITAFYSVLGIRSAMWTTPATDRPRYLEASKPIEYVLELDEDRVVAYVNEHSWSDYLYDKRENFEYSTTPTQYKMTSILVKTPITKTDVKAIRRYRRTNGPDEYELVEEITF